MFLRSLTMKGFKSFADPTVFEFEPGITVVVGPNGSGKSNIVDATTWVLGAQGPRLLRSQKMEDVIFAGTSARSALGRAEVSMTIDNSSGLLPIDLAEVTITRTLFRSGESEYALNGTPCRLLDVQELLADSGVGRQQHMIIGQGQLDSVLSTRAEDRRAIIEEAAGVLKHRRRRERAERRLAATEENLDRLGDLVREVRRQIRPLERQAAAARSHQSLEQELHALRLYLAGRELRHLADRHGTASANRAALSEEERRLQRVLAALDAEAGEATAQLSSSSSGDLAATVARVQGLLERSRGIGGVLRERLHGLRASLDAAADVDVVSTLEAEAARLAGDLSAVEDEERVLDAERESLSDEQRRLAEEGCRRLSELSGDVDPRDAEGALARAADQRASLRRAAEQHRRAASKAASRLYGLRRREASLQETWRSLEQRAAEAAAGQHRVMSELEAAETTCTQRGAREAEASSAADLSARERHRTAAQADALARALEELSNQPGRKLLAGASGVVGALADLVAVEPGWEAAFEAAAGGAEGAVVVDGQRCAREAIGLLHDHQVTGAVLCAPEPLRSREVAGGAVGQAGRAPGSDGPGAGVVGELAAPPWAEPLRPHARARHGSAQRGSTAEGPAGALEELLDRLLARVVRVPTWQHAIDLALQRPDLVVVTGAGDRFSQDGWRVRRGAPAVNPAAVEAAVSRARVAEREAGAADRRKMVARKDHEEALRSVAEAQRSIDRQRSVAAGIAAEQGRVRELIAQVNEDIEMADQEAAASEADASTAESELSRLEECLADLERQVTAARAARGAVDAERAELEEQHRDLAARSQTQDREAASLRERHRVLAQRRDEIERRLGGHVEERREAEARRSRLERNVAVVCRLEEVVTGARQSLEMVHARISDAYRTQVEAARAGGRRLDALHRERNLVERELDGQRERGRVLDLELAEISMRAGTLAEVVRYELGSDPERAAGTPCPALPEGVSPQAHVEHLTSKLAAMGPVNPLALEELNELQARSAELDGQVQDVRNARRELHQVVRHLDEEIMQSFAAAMADVNEHFSGLAATLFPGGTGRLVLTDPDNLLDTGVDIEVRPLGRNVRRVSLLSGGERSLVAIAFLFAVFRSRPSPFYLMDEVEAALDDVNLHRFLELAKEFRNEAQLIIVSHQKRTMEMADALYGVTMAPGGSSQVVSQRVERNGDHSGAPAARNGDHSAATAARNGKQRVPGREVQPTTR